ncbi:MAG: peptidylprolyl isomerase [Victivallaceae bacterium]|nr:peptidylprolyl isomerase [Victivallaceae bacterium]MDD3117350.1 peptidylprolyl isomerase [Victivallaceae bacterium]MDD3702669.1 peptidylprolyl isomerase [Victivallaceae bacterium]MDD4317589.1 peptidylprolyl isomerase [Victivallaceae bacterium]NLK83574.1 hypothetical protein [Lentisphaerota bacterium]
MKFLIVFLLMTVMLLPFRADEATQPGKRIDSILVSVNGTPISLLDVLYESRHAESRMAVMYSANELFEEIRKYRMSVLEELIKRQLIIDDFKKKPYNIPNQLIEGMLDDLSVEFNCGSRRELELKAKEMGTSLADLRRKATERLIVQSMIATYCYRHVHLTPRDIHEYYQQNQDEFTINSKVKISVIFLKKDRTDRLKAVNDIVECLKNDPNKFAALAELYTDGPASESGGSLGWIEEKSLRKEFTKALTDLEVGKFSGPLDTDEGTYFIFLSGREDARVQSFNDAGGQLYREIEKRMKDEAAKRYVEELKAGAIIRYCH